MTRLRTCSVASSTLCVLVALAAPAAAQDRDAPLSPRERSYVEGLGRQFGAVSFADRSQFVVGEPEIVDLSADAPARPPASVADGILVRAGDTTIARYRFASPEEAQAEARRVLETPVEGSRAPLVGEVRGNQVLVLSGEVAKDPAAAREALDASWQGLPAPAAPDATFAVLGPRDLAISTTLKDGPLRESIDKALAKARERAGTPEFQETPDGMAVRSPSGFEADLRVDDQGASALLRSGPGGPATNEYLGLIDPNADARSAEQARGANQAATEGAARKLDGLFGD